MVLRCSRMSFEMYTMVFQGVLVVMLVLGILINLVAYFKKWSVGEAILLVFLTILLCLIVFGIISYYYLENAEETTGAVSMALAQRYVS